MTTDYDAPFFDAIDLHIASTELLASLLYGADGYPQPTV